MKYIFSLLFLFCASTVLAEKLDVDGEFRLLKADGMPLEWLIQRKNNPQHGKFELLTDGGVKTIQIAASPKLEACFYTEPAFAVFYGESIEVSAEVQSRNSVRVMIYFYDVEKRWITSRSLLSIDGTEKFRKVSEKMIIAPVYPGDADGMTRKPYAIRIALVVPAGGKASFRHIRAEKRRL